MGNVVTFKCVHCSGTGVCAHAYDAYTAGSPGFLWIPRGTAYKYCQRCGAGPEIKYFGVDQRSEYWRYCTAPFCAVCGGKGYTVAHGSE